MPGPQCLRDERRQGTVQLPRGWREQREDRRGVAWKCLAREEKVQRPRVSGGDNVPGQEPLEREQLSCDPVAPGGRTGGVSDWGQPQAQ